MAFAVSLRLYNFLICQKMNINCSIHMLLNFKVRCSFFSTWCQWNQLSDLLSGLRLDLSTPVIVNNELYNHKLLELLTW